MEAWVYVVLLGAFIVAMAWIRPKNTPAAGDSESRLEQILDAFMVDMENENQKWHRELESIRDQSDRQIRLLQDQVHQLEAQLKSASLTATPMGKGAELNTEAHQTVRAVPTDKPILKEEPPEAGGKLENRYEEIFKLAGKGKTVHFISKKTGYPHGEVELILQLAKQGDPS
jgi:hypothetical protein